MAFNAQHTTLSGRITRSVSGITATASPGRFVRSAGSFIADGFLKGMTFTTTATGNTSQTFTITNVTATQLDVSPAPVAIATPETASFTLTAEIGEMTDFSGLGGSANEIDTTHLKSTAREFVMGLKDSGTFTAEVQFQPGDVGQIFLRQRQDVLSVPTLFLLRLSDPDATEISFNAFVQSFSISGAVDEKATASVTLRITGVVTYGDMP